MDDGWYEKKCQRLEEELTGRKEALKLEQEKNAKLVHALKLKLEQVVKLRQTVEQLQTQTQDIQAQHQANRADLQRVQSQLPGGQEMQTQAVELGEQERAELQHVQRQLPGGQVMQLGPSWSTGRTARWPSFFGPAERGCSGHASPAPPGCGHPPDPEQS